MTASLLDTTHAQLLIVDVQEKFRKVIFNAETLVPAVGRLAEGAALLGLPVTVTEQYPEGLGHTVIEVARVLPETAVTFAKLGFSAFSEPLVRQRLENNQRNQVIVCGLEAHVCIHQTVHDLLRQGFDVHLALDATGSRKSETYKTAVKRMKDDGAIRTTSESALFELLRSAAHPQFKAVQALVK